MPEPNFSALLEILVCPACHAKVDLGAMGDRLLCRGCGRAYPIEDGIPVMLEERAFGGPTAAMAKKENS